VLNYVIPADANPGLARVKVGFRSGCDSAYLTQMPVRARTKFEVTS
jgi:hypothetical protein